MNQSPIINNWTPEWIERVKGLLNIAKDDTNDKLISEIATVTSEIASKEAEISELETGKKSASETWSAWEKASEQRNRVRDNFDDFKMAWRNFSGQGSNNYRGRGWPKLVAKYQEVKTTLNATSREYDNLYRGSLAVETAPNAYTLQEIIISEQECLKLLARIVKTLGEIDKSKFLAVLEQADVTKYKKLKDREDGNLGSANPPQQTDWNTYKNWVATTLTRLQLIAQHGLTSSVKKINQAGKIVAAGTEIRTEYEFAGDYTKNKNGESYVDPAHPHKILKFTSADLTDLLNLLSDIHHSELVDNLDESSQNIDQGADYPLLPVKKDSTGQPLAYTPAQLTSWGLPSNEKVQLYGSDSDWTKVQKWKISGLKSWLALLDSLMKLPARVKLLNSFTADPYSDLVSDLRTYQDREYAFTWNDEGTPRPLTLDLYPQTLGELETRVAQLKVEYDALKGGVKDQQKVIISKRQEITTAQAQIASKKKTITDLLTTKKATIIKDLTDIHQLTKGFGKTTSEDNRRTAQELVQIKQKIKNLRFLEHGQEEKPSSLTNEATIMSELTTIWNQYTQNNFVSSWPAVAWVKDSQKSPSTEEKIAKIKANEPDEQGIKIYETLNLTWFHDSLLELEKIVKLTADQAEVKTKLQVALGQQTPEESAQDWQNTFQTLEAGLETVFTATKIAQWKAKKEGQEAFNNLVSVQSLLTSVQKDEQYQDFFTEIKSWTETKDLDNWNKLLAKEPQVVITAIKRYQYQQLTGAEKIQQERKIKKLLKKKGGDILSQTEINTALYQVAIGVQTFSTSDLDENLNEIITPTDNEERPPLWYQRYYYMVIWLPTLFFLGIVAWLYSNSAKKNPDNNPDQEEAD